MNDVAIFQMILAITAYCQAENSSQRECFAKIWSCAHKVSVASAMGAELNNCISKDLRGIVK